MPKQGHSLFVEFRGQAIHLALVCHEPEGSSCRLTCSEGCESWNEHSHEHPLVDQGECNVVLFIESGDVAEACDWTDPFPVYNGMPVAIEWDGGTYLWIPAGPAEELEKSG